MSVFHITWQNQYQYVNNMLLHQNTTASNNEIKMATLYFNIAKHFFYIKCSVNPGAGPLQHLAPILYNNIRIYIRHSSVPWFAWMCGTSTTAFQVNQLSLCSFLFFSTNMQNDRTNKQVSTELSMSMFNFCKLFSLSSVFDVLKGLCHQNFVLNLFRVCVCSTCMYRSQIQKDMCACHNPHPPRISCSLDTGAL